MILWWLSMTVTFAIGCCALGIHVLWRGNLLGAFVHSAQSVEVRHKWNLEFTGMSNYRVGANIFICLWSDAFFTSLFYCCFILLCNWEDLHIYILYSAKHGSQQHGSCQNFLKSVLLSSCFKIVFTPELRIKNFAMSISVP